ncbi:MAG: GntR family transcriptional regulator [Pyrinomonadaceae bacterium]
MQFLLDKKLKTTLFAQARAQLLAALHLGKVRVGDRLPSVRQIALSNKINAKTASLIYQHLCEEGYVNLRAGSGVYVADTEKANLEEAYCLSLFRLITSHLSEASRLKLEPLDYSKLVQKFLSEAQLKRLRLAVVECNEEQIEVFSSELSNRLGPNVYPLLLSKLENPDRALASVLSRVDYFATTDYHFKQVKALTSKYQKKLLRLRLNPAFVPQIIAAAHAGRVVMVVSNTDYFPAFRRSLLSISTPRKVVDRIVAVDCGDAVRIRAALSQARAVYVSAICDVRARRLIPKHVKELKFESIISPGSMEQLEAVLRFYVYK